MDRLSSDLRLALRSLRRQPGFTAIVVLTLALGIGVNASVWSALYGILLRPLPLIDTDGLYALGMRHATQRVEAFDFSPPDIEDFAGQCSVCAGVAAFDGQTVVLASDDEAQRVRGQAVDPELFQVLGVDAQLGRTLVAGENQPGSPRVAVISHALWQRLGGAADLVGSDLDLDGRPTTVVGVMPQGFRFPERADLWFPLERNDALRSDRFVDNVLLRLRPGVTHEQAQAAADAIGARLAAAHPLSNQGWGFTVLSFRERLVDGEERQSLFLLACAVGFVLLIACVNVTNLLLARESGRQRSAAIRLALGSDRFSLIRERMIENLLLATGGGVLGALLSAWVMDWVAGADPQGLPAWLDLRLGYEGMLIAFGLTVAAAFLFGLVPAYRSTHPELAKALADGQRGSTVGGERRRLQQALVIAQITLALILLVGAGLVIESVVALTRIDAGFDTHDVLTLRAQLQSERYREPADRVALYERLVQRLENLPGVRAAAATSAIPLLEDGTAVPLSHPGQLLRDGERQIVTYILQTPGLFDVLQVPLLAGRHFTAAEASDPESRVAIVNAELARQIWGDKDPIGERIQVGHAADSPWSTVVGVVPKIYYERPGGETDQSRFQVHIPYARVPWRTMGVMVRTAGDAASLAPDVRQALREVDPTMAVDGFRTLDGVRLEVTWAERLQSQLFGGFALLALILAAVGIYGVMVFVVSDRVPEIVVRMAFGADRRHIAALFLRHGIWLVGSGLILGLLGAWGVARFLSSVLYSAGEGSLTAFVAAFSLLFLAAALGIALPTRRATRVEPAAVLRGE